MGLLLGLWYAAVVNGEEWKMGNFFHIDLKKICPNKKKR